MYLTFKLVFGDFEHNNEHKTSLYFINFNQRLFKERTMPEALIQFNLDSVSLTKKRLPSARPLCFEINYLTHHEVFNQK